MHLYMNICIYTVHLFLYECITCKVVWSVTVHSVSTVLPDVNYGNSLYDSYCTEIQKAALLMYAIFPFKSTNLHITYVGYWKRLFQNVLIIEDMVDLPIFSCTLQPL